MQRFEELEDLRVLLVLDVDTSGEAELFQR